MIIVVQPGGFLEFILLAYKIVRKNIHLNPLVNNRVPEHAISTRVEF